MKFLHSLLFIILPSLAKAEATGGYSYGFGGDIIGVVVVVVIVIVVLAFFMLRRRK